MSQDGFTATLPLGFNGAPYTVIPGQDAASVGSVPLTQYAASQLVQTLPPAQMTVPPTLPPAASMGMGNMGMPGFGPPTGSMHGPPMGSTASLGPSAMGGTGSMGMVPPTLPPSQIPPASMGPQDFTPQGFAAAPAYGTMPQPEQGRDDNSEVVRRVERIDKTRDEDFAKWHNVRQFIAYMFTLTAFTILAAPTIISIQLGLDVDAAFWIGKWGLCALFVPVFLIGQHFYHLWMLNDRKRRRRYIFIIVPVLPAVLFMVIGGTYMSTSRHLYGQLKAEDCSASSPVPAKFWMQNAYDEAHAAYDQCLVRLQKENFGHPLRRHPNLQSCTEWDALRENKKGVEPWKGYKVSPGTLRQHNPSNEHRWQYLADVEINHLCGGFCKAGPSLFVSYDLVGRRGGSCAQFVAFRFLSIMHWGIVVFSIGLLVLCLSIPTYIFSRSFLTNMGYKSAVTLG